MRGREAGGWGAGTVMLHTVTSCSMGSCHLSTQYTVILSTHSLSLLQYLIIFISENLTIFLKQKLPDSFCCSIFWFIFSKLRVQSWQSSAWSGLERIYYRKLNMNNFKPKQPALIRWEMRKPRMEINILCWKYWAGALCFIFNNPITILFLPIILIGLFFTDDRPDV